MSWQDWAVAAIGVLVVAWLVSRLVRRLRGKDSGSSCYGCECADSCPSAHKDGKCPSETGK